MPRSQALLLGPVSLLDCLVFCLCLAPQLLLQAGLYATLACGLRALPFLLIQLPLAIAAERCLPPARSSSSAPQPAALFEDVVLRCVRWGFVHIPPRVGRVFFSPAVALPFHRFRQLRHRLGRGRDTSHSRASGSLLSLHWREHQGAGFRGIWVVRDPTTPPDVVVFFVHGGGFVLGSSHFYLELLLSWATLLVAAPLGANGHGHDHGTAPAFRNPAVFSLDYTLAPDAVFPTQLHQAVHAYEYTLATTAAQTDPPPVVVAGDSAGGTLVLGLLLYLARLPPPLPSSPLPPRPSLAPPALAVLISPWVSLWSRRYQRSRADYVDVATLASFARQYVGGSTPSARRTPIEKHTGKLLIDPLISPGDCRDRDWWCRASPTHGLLVTYGEDEVFAPDIRAWAAKLQGYGIAVQLRPDSGPGVHAWPVASLFLGSSEARRFGSLIDIVEVMKQRLANRQAG